MKLRNLSSYIITAIFILFFSKDAIADFQCPTTKSGDKSFFRIYGTITKSDVEGISRCFAEGRVEKYREKTIDSPGGDVYAAMEIGAILRRNRVELYVGQKQQCLSSCVLILAGAVDRHVFGQVGIHRPYSLKTGVIDFENAQTEYSKTRDDVQEYLNKMNIPVTLFNLMERIPPEEIKYLSSDELGELGLSDIDPVEQEIGYADEADLRGISKIDYLARLIEAEHSCKVNGEHTLEMVEWYYLCNEAVSWGLTVSVYKTRNPKISKICRPYGVKFGSKSAEYRKCYREIMLGFR